MTFRWWKHDVYESHRGSILMQRFRFQNRNKISPTEALLSYILNNKMSILEMENMFYIKKNNIAVYLAHAEKKHYGSWVLDTCWVHIISNGLYWNHAGFLALGITCILLKSDVLYELYQDLSIIDYWKHIKNTRLTSVWTYQPFGLHTTTYYIFLHNIFLHNTLKAQLWTIE